MAESSSDIIRRMRNGILSETVHAWHYATQGPGERGGRTYYALYALTGAVRIDVSDACSSGLRTLWIEAKEIRPREEWLAHLKATGQPLTNRRYCAIDGMEIAGDSDPGLDEGCCSTGCRSDFRPDW